MGKLLLLGSLLLSTTIFASMESVEVGGTFINNEGCRVYQVNCSNFQAEDGDNYNSCSFEVYVDGEYVARLGKGGKIVSATSKKIVAVDKGLRSTLSIPEIVNVKAELSINSTYIDNGTYPELSVSGFDLVVKKGIFGREVVRCNDLVWEESEI